MDKEKAEIEVEGLINMHTDGNPFNNLVTIHLDNVPKLAQEIVKLFAIPVVVPSTFDFIIEYDDADGTMAKTVITGDNAPDAIWKFTEQYGLEWLTIKKVE